MTDAGISFLQYRTRRSETPMLKVSAKNFHISKEREETDVDLIRTGFDAYKKV